MWRVHVKGTAWGKHGAIPMDALWLALLELCNEAALPAEQSFGG